MLRTPSLAMCLPWPPSLNTYYRSLNKGPLAGRVLISEKGRDYRAHVQMLVRGVNAFVGGRIKIELGAYPPDKRARDLDNLLKCVLDSLQEARIIENDSMIDDLQIIRGEVRKGGEMHVKISEIQ